MNKWIWYVGWLVAWFIAFTFIFVPLADQFRSSGALRGLILICGGVLLLLGFRFLYKRLRTQAADAADSHDFSLPVRAKGMSAREAKIVADAREQALGKAPGEQGDADPARSFAIPDVASPKSDANTDVVRQSMDYVPGGVLRSAGNPLVRSAFAQAMQEVETKTYDAGLWAMAMVECNGDEKMARLAYMKARASDLAWAHAKAAESEQKAARQQEDRGGGVRPARERTKPNSRS